MYVEVSIYLHQFQTPNGVVEIKSADIDPNTVWSNSGNDFDYTSYIGNIVTDETTVIFVNLLD